MTKRLNATLNFICTYEKVITINKRTVDVIEEFELSKNCVVLYGYHDTYRFDFSEVEIKVENVYVHVKFHGETEVELTF